MANSSQLQIEASKGNYDLVVREVRGMRKGEKVILYSQPVSRDESQVDMEALKDQMRIKLGDNYRNYNQSVSNTNGQWRLELQRK